MMPEEKNMNVLKISLDINLLKQTQIEDNDAIERRILLARGVTNLFVIVYSTEPQKKPFTPIENLKIYSTASINKITRPLDAIQIGKNICSTHKIDLITTQDPFFTGWAGMRLAKKFGIPLNVQLHADCIGNLLWLHERPLNRLMNAISKRVLKKADSFRVVSGWEKRKLVRLGYPAEKIRVIPEGINTEKFTAADGRTIRTQYQKAGYDKILFFAGRITAQKNLPMLLRSFKMVVKEFPKAVLLMAGKGEGTDHLIKLSKNLAIDENVKFIGAIPYTEMPHYFAAADIFVLSSNYEGNARVMMEASVIGVPIVSTKVSGADEVVKNGINGFIVEVGDTEAFTQRLLDVLNDERIRERCAGLRPEMIETFGRLRHIEQMHRLWRETVKEK